MNDLAITDRQLIPNWEPGRDLPSGTNRDAILRQVGVLQARLAPAGPKEIAVALKQLFEFMDGCGMYYKLEAAVKIHCQALAGCPIWAIERAIKSITLGWRDHKSPPYPADVVNALPGELQDLMVERARLKAAVDAYDAGKIAPPEDEMATKEEWAEFLKMARPGA